MVLWYYGTILFMLQSVITHPNDWHTPEKAKGALAHRLLKNKVSSKTTKCLEETVAYDAPPQQVTLCEAGSLIVGKEVNKTLFIKVRYVVDSQEYESPPHIRNCMIQKGHCVTSHEHEKKTETQTTVTTLVKSCVQLLLSSVLLRYVQLSASSCMVSNIKSHPKMWWLVNLVREVMNSWQGMAWHGMAWQGRAGHGMAWQGRAGQGRAGQGTYNKAELWAGIGTLRHIKYC